jgi:peptidoglycan/xylan/chitin deacetylase (PgdA/CDA1 family)
MRWPWIVGALGAVIAGGVAVTGIAVAGPEPRFAASESSGRPSIFPPPPENPPLIEEEAPQPEVDEPPDYPVERKPAPKLAEIDVSVKPNEFTNDPVLGRSERVVGEGVRGMIAFTFDDGPVPSTTPAILAALKKYDIPASFFIVTRHFGHKKPEYRQRAKELLAQEVADGHIVGSHTIMHERLLYAGTREIDREVDGSLKELAAFAQKPIGMFRAPFGKISYTGRKRLKALGVTEVFWSIDPRDWEAVSGDEQYMRNEVAYAIRNAGGGVILLHDSKPVTAAIIERVFDDLEAYNCKKLALKQEPIYPVSLHYFLRDEGDKPRPVPPEVAARTEAYKTALPGRCAARKKPKKSLAK